MTSAEIIWVHLIVYGLSTLLMLWAVAGQAGYVVALTIAFFRGAAGEPVNPRLPLLLDQPRLLGYALRGIEWGWSYVALVLRLGHRAYGGPPAPGGAEVQPILVPGARHGDTLCPGGAVYPPDVVDRARIALNGIVAGCPIIIRMLGAPLMMVRVRGRTVVIRLPRWQQRIIAGLVTHPEIDNRRQVGTFQWPDPEPAAAKSARLATFVHKIRETYAKALVAAGAADFALARLLAEELFRSGRGYIRLARNMYQTDIEIAHRLITDTVECAGDDPELAAALSECAAHLVGGAPLARLEEPLRGAQIEWATEWIEDYREETLDELEAVLHEAIQHAHEHDLPTGPFEAALERLGRPLDE